MTLMNSYRDRHMFLNDNEKAGTSCIVFTRRFLRFAASSRVVFLPVIAVLCKMSLEPDHSFSDFCNRNCRLGSPLAQIFVSHAFILSSEKVDPKMGRLAPSIHK